MTDTLTQDQFRTAVADATAAVLNVYREVDAMFRELAAALADGEPSFSMLVKRLVPGSGRKNPDARYLRNYVAAVFAPVNSVPEDEEEEDGEDEEEEEEDAPKTKQKRAILVPVGSGIVLARAAIYDRSVPNFEPHLMMAVLTNCRVDVPTEPNAQVRVPRSRFKTIQSALGRHRASPGQPFPTGVPVQLEGQPKNKPKHRLVFDLPHPVRRYPLFELKPDKVIEVAHATQEAWRTATVK